MALASILPFLMATAMAIFSCVDASASSIEEPKAKEAESPKAPVTMKEALWAVELEEKVVKKGYTPSPEEMTRYQGILQRYKANSRLSR